MIVGTSSPFVFHIVTLQSTLFGRVYANDTMIRFIYALDHYLEQWSGVETNSPASVDRYVLRFFYF